MSTQVSWERLGSFYSAPKIVLPFLSVWTSWFRILWAHPQMICNLCIWGQMKAAAIASVQSGSHWMPSSVWLPFLKKKKITWQYYLDLSKVGLEKVVDKTCCIQSLTSEYFWSRFWPQRVNWTVFGPKVKRIDKTTDSSHNKAKWGIHISEDLQLKSNLIFFYSNL